jgi:hypothetical protein
MVWKDMSPRTIKNCWSNDVLPISFIDSNMSLRRKQQKSKESRHAPWLEHFGGLRGVLELREGTRKNDKHLITHTNLHKPNNKLVSA